MVFNFQGLAWERKEKKFYQCGFVNCTKHDNAFQNT